MMNTGFGFAVSINLPAVRVTEHVHSIRIRHVPLLDPFERRVEELYVSITKLAWILLPTVELAFRIGNALNARLALHVDDHSLRPQLVNSKPTRGVLCVAAVPVKDKNNRRASPRD